MPTGPRPSIYHGAGRLRVSADAPLPGVGTAQPDYFEMRALAAQSAKLLRGAAFGLQIDLDFPGSAARDAFLQHFVRQFESVPAAGGLVFAPDENGSERLLVIRRLGKYDLPKGKLERGETYAETARRETEEETGLTGLPAGAYFDATHHIYPLRNDLFALKYTYWAIFEYPECAPLTPQTEEAIASAEWLPADKSLLELDFYESLKPLLRQALKSRKQK